MIAYSKERLDNAVAYFAGHHEEITGNKAYKTYIFKYIALFDFLILDQTGKPAFDIEYAALERGPVPVFLYDHIDEYESSFFIINEDKDGNHYLTSTVDIKMDYFSEFEQKKLVQIVDDYIFKGMKTDDVCDRTHTDITAWRIAWENRGTARRVPMDYIDEFDDISEKEACDLTLKEESFWVHRGLELVEHTPGRNDI